MGEETTKEVPVKVLFVLLGSVGTDKELTCSILRERYKRRKIPLVSCDEHDGCPKKTYAAARGRRSYYVIVDGIRHRVDLNTFIGVSERASERGVLIIPIHHRENTGIGTIESCDHLIAGDLSREAHAKEVESILSCY